jgi:hypothetical protein
MIFDNSFGLNEIIAEKHFDGELSIINLEKFNLLNTKKNE